MNLKQKVITLAILLSSFASAGLAAQPLFAQSTCGGANTAIISCPQNNSGGSAQNNGVWGVLLIALNILTAGVGIAAVGGIVYGAILYTTAEDSPQQTQRAKEIIRDVIIGLVCYGLMFIGLNFLVPGGIFQP